jgi:hypothetical protein
MQVFKLEEQREKSLDKLVVKIQRAWRSFRARKWYLELRATTQDLFHGKKQRRRNSLNRKYWGDYLQLKFHKGVQAMLRKQGPLAGRGRDIYTHTDSTSICTDTCEPTHPHRHTHPQSVCLSVCLSVLPCAPACALGG